jgi:hypothetical protein
MLIGRQFSIRVPEEDVRQKWLGEAVKWEMHKKSKINHLHNTLLYNCHLKFKIGVRGRQPSACLRRDCNKL